MKKKFLSIILSAGLLVSVLTGCSGSTGEKATESVAVDTESPAAGTEESAEAESSAEETDTAGLSGELIYWTFTDSAYNLAKAFNEVYPDIIIDVQVFGGDEYKTKILTALQSGDNVPDIFDLEENYMYEFLDSDLIADLSYMNIEELTQGYYDFQVAGMKDTAGNYKCLCFQSSPVGFWYLRDACEEWLGTSDPDEISAMLSDWETIIAKGEEVCEKSNGTVSLWPNITEMVKVDAFSFDPLVRNGKLEITEDWTGLIDSMRVMYNTDANAELGSWGSEWAAAWNNGTLLFRVMPCWDFFTDWDANTGNVGIATPFHASYEGATGLCVYNSSENKDLAAVFLAYVASDDFQRINMEEYNQVPASKKVCDELSEGFAADNFGGQNLLRTYSQICDKVVGITPDKYTRSTQNLFQKAATDGIKEGQDNDTIINNFKKELADQYPEVIIE